MARPETWAEFFEIPPEDIQEWQSQLPAGESLLRWCLMHGHLPETRYFPWAMHTFELPKVKKTFFAIPADTVFWDRVKNLHAWSSELLPLAEWQGRLMIGCVQPPTDAMLPMPHHFVLASAQDLQLQWEKFVPQTKSVEPTAPPRAPDLTSLANGDHEMGDEPSHHSSVSFEGPEGLNADGFMPSEANSPKHFDEATHFDTDDLNNDSGPESFDADADHSADHGSDAAGDGQAAADDEEGQELLEGLIFDSSKAATLDFSALMGSSGVKVEAADAADPVNENTAGGVSLIMPSEAILMADLPPIPAPEFSVKPSSPPLMRPAAPAAKSLFEEAKQTDWVRPPVVPAVDAPNLDAGGSDLDRIADNSMVSFVSQVADANHSPLNGLAQKSLTSTQSYDDLALQTLLRIQGIFQSGMILMFQGGQLRPWKWTDLLHSVHGTTPKAIAVADASIFRIVLRTALPYHGYIVPNPINDAFFNEFNRGKTPAHVTLMPILIDRQVSGMLMGLTDGELDYKLSLSRMQDLSNEVAKELRRLRELKVA